MIAGFIVASSTGGSGQASRPRARTVVRRFQDLGSSGRSRARISTTATARSSPRTTTGKATRRPRSIATGLPPTNDAEAAILITLAPGAYTAIESGKNGGTGVGLIEVYNLH